MQILSLPEIFGRLLYMISTSSGQSLQLVTAIHTEDGVSVTLLWGLQSVVVGIYLQSHRYVTGSRLMTSVYVAASDSAVHTCPRDFCV